MTNEHKFDAGVIGMGVMGFNLLMNMRDHGFSVVGLDNNTEKVNDLERKHANEAVAFTSDTGQFISHLASPKKILIMVPAGKPVDGVLDSLLPYLGSGDVVMDGGNSFFEDTENRYQAMQAKGIHFFGVGVSGGEEGARMGPSIMPGGDSSAYTYIEPVLESIAAKVDGDPCVAYLGDRSAGHYVKMVHNGIEYGLMQLLAEAYDILKNCLGLSNKEIASVFNLWNEGRLNSFLVEITSHIFLQPDDRNSDRQLIDYILDQAKQKGTGKWTSQSAHDLGVAIPNIDVAVMMRYISAQKSLRVQAESMLSLPKSSSKKDQVKTAISQLESALYAAFIITYAQGFHLLKVASKEWEYSLRLTEIARIWRGGCIIRAAMLNDIVEVFTEEPELENLMLSDKFLNVLQQARIPLIETLRMGLFNQLPLPGLSAALNYLDAHFSARLPANLIQAQRDYFGSHTYERIDIPGTFHTKWHESDQ